MMDMAWTGHKGTQMPQPMHFSVSTNTDIIHFPFQTAYKLNAYTIIKTSKSYPIEKFIQAFER